MGQKKIFIIAGPNGAGKTTFANEFLPNEAGCPIFINADIIATGLSSLRPTVAAIRAGRMMLEEIKTHAKQGDNFAFETTLSGRTYVSMIRAWRRQKYQVKLIFLSLANPEEAIGRVAERVAQGGHYVPDEVVRRRFYSGLNNFQAIYRFEVDFWHRYDNSGAIFKLVEEGKNP